MSVKLTCSECHGILTEVDGLFFCRFCNKIISLVEANEGLKKLFVKLVKIDAK